MLFASSANAAIVLSINSPVAPVLAGDTLNVQVFVRGDAGDNGIALTADFGLSGGFFNSPAGLFGQPGMVGAGNIFAPGSSFNRDVNDFSLAYLSIDFLDTQFLPVADSLLAVLSINTTGLAAGTYDINVINADLNGNIGTFSGGSFTVAVPEPTSMLTVGLGMAGLWYGRRRMKSKVSA